MKLESILKSAAVCFLTLALSAVAFGQNQSATTNPNNKANNPSKVNKPADRDLYADHVLGTVRDEEKQSRKAASLLKEIMKTPDKGIPQNVLDRAECVMSFPEVRKANSSIATYATYGGRGIVSCRTGSGWSSPVYLNFRSDTIGPQVGVESTDVVIVFMTKDIVNSLPNNKFTVGVDAPAVAGPVGPVAGPAADAVMNAQILGYSRSKGKVVGTVMDGAVIEVAQNDMRDVYGDNFNPKEIMEGSKTNAPSKVMVYSETLSRYTPRQARK